jgi:hypothetical protein
MANKGGTSSTCGRLPNPLRMRFFSVKEYVAVDMACEPQLRAAVDKTRLGGEAKIGNCESSSRRRISIPDVRPCFQKQQRAKPGHFRTQAWPELLKKLILQINLT